MKPAVGRILHFYDRSADPTDTHRKGVEINGQGAGPYAAIVTQVHGDAMVSLRAFAHGGEFTESSVDLIAADAPQEGRFCVWPPRDEPVATKEAKEAGAQKLAKPAAEPAERLTNTEKAKRAAAAKAAKDADDAKTTGDGT